MINQDLEIANRLHTLTIKSWKVLSKNGLIYFQPMKFNVKHFFQVTSTYTALEESKQDLNEVKNRYTE